MFLGRRKSKSIGFNSGYRKLLPPRLPPERIIELVEKLRNGSLDVFEELILQHLALAIHIVGRYVKHFPDKTDDLMSVAALTVTECVHSFANASHDNNLAGYITSNIHGKLSHFIKEEDRLIQVSWSGFSKAQKKAKKEGNAIDFYLPRTTSLDHTTRNDSEEEYEGARDSVSIAPSVNDDDTKLEIEEILSKCCLTRFEFLVYEKLTQGTKESKIARELGYCKQRINQIKKTLAAKLKPFFGELDAVFH